MSGQLLNKTHLLLICLPLAACAAWLAPFAHSSSILDTHGFEIVARLTGPAGSNSINPTWQVGIGGTDLGHMVNHNGKIYFLFGDTFESESSGGSGGPDWRQNVMAYSTDFNPADGITFDGWITRINGTARQVIFPGAEQGIPGFEPITYIPTGAISANNKIYAWSMRIDWDGFPEPPGEPDTDGWMLSHAGLASWREGDSLFTNVPGFRFEAPNGGAYSWAGGAEGPGNFGMVAASYRSPLENANDPHIYLWGTPGGREGGVKLARVLPSDIENLSAYQFFDGELNGVPQWVGNEFDAEKIIPSRPEGGSGVGEMSVMYNAELREWTLMSISGGAAPDFEIRHAPNPWGPWSNPVTVTDFGQAPGLYSPYMNPLLVEDNGKTLYFTMSLWNPYDVYLAKVSLDIDYRTAWDANIGTWATDSNWTHGAPNQKHYVTLDNGGVMRINTSESAREILAGTAAGLGATMEVVEGAVLNVTGGNLHLAHAGASTSTFSMTGGSVQVLDIGRRFTIADGGDATATISGGTIMAREFSVAHQPTATGHLEIGGDAVITIVGDRFHMGRQRNSTTGQLSNASMTMTGGTINVNQNGSSPSLRDFVVGWEGQATIDMSGGAINANNFATAVIGANGAAPSSQGSIVQSGGTVTTGGMNLAERGVSQYTLSGSGKINVRGLMRLAWLAGSQSTFTQNGGTVDVALDNPSPTYVGLKIGEGGQGAYTISAGTLNVPGELWVADLSGSTGQLNVHGGHVNVGGSLRVQQAGIVSVAGGTLNAAEIQHNHGGDFSFTGGTLQVETFIGNLTHSGGTLAPGPSAASTSVAGDYVQQAGAMLALEIGGTSPGNGHDRIDITGSTTLGGELLLSLIDGFIPSPSESFILLDAATIFGAFTNVAPGQRLTTIDQVGSFLIHYGSGSPFGQNHIVATGFQAGGDFNNDGTVDAADYVVWRRGVTSGTMEPDDLNLWTANFGTSSAASPNVIDTVPEPSDLTYFLLSLIAIVIAKPGIFDACRARYAKQ